jgi:acetyl-CoA decarbonylase/synthase complex subunit delta
MAVEILKENYTGKVITVTIGTGDKVVSVGGASALPFHSFEGDVGHRPLIACEVLDALPEDPPPSLQAELGGIWEDPVKWAQYCQNELSARAVALRLISTDPDGQDADPESAAETVTKVLDAIDIPLIILGCFKESKDGAVLKAAADAARGRNCLIGKAQEENYKTIAAAAASNGHKLIAFSNLDFNLAKQINILLSQADFDINNIVTDPTASALGYGLEYTYSVIERIRSAGLMQNDAMMQPPMFLDLSSVVWKVKEVKASEEQMPEWGDVIERGVNWEASTAVSLLMAGAEILVMTSPRAIQTVEKTIDQLMP